MVSLLDCLKNIDIVILAGGQGTRIKNTLGNTPKLLAPIGNKFFLDLLISRLKYFGVQRVVLSLGYLAENILQYINSNPPDGIEIIIKVESSPLGTAGSIRFVRQQINTNPVLIMNGDSFFSADLCKFVHSFKAGSQKASILCSNVDDTTRFGQLKISSDGKVQAFCEKNPKKTGPGIISTGIYLFSTAMLETICHMPGSSLEYDVFTKLPSCTLAAFIGEGIFIDIGTPEDFERAPELLAPFI
ncbi:MAG: sugar phosphate nucleotidyltransferase [Pseudomonadota bacterium]|nr:sugar phosphate nucleotidyltransferase [Pseudomonadota bacterium]